MSSASLSIAGGANLGGARSFTQNTQIGAVHSAIVLTLRKLFPRKTWGSLAHLTGCSERVAKHRMACERAFTTDEIALLLRSEQGIHFLADLMGDARPKWYRGFLAHVAAGNARRALRQQERELREAIDAVESLDGTIARSETSLALQDEDFYRPQIDAERTFGRFSGRTLAPAAGTRGRR